MLSTDELDQLRSDVEAYAARRNGKIYAPICHPAFEDVAYEHGPERFDLMAPFIPRDAETALDIGTHWGFFAHKLEESGLQVTAVESLKEYLPFLHRIKRLYGDKFQVFEGSVFTMPGTLHYDVILALNIFHHFIKNERVFGQFTNFLSRLDCKVMFFQSHHPGEGQMTGAYRNFGPEEFCRFILDNTTLTDVKEIGWVKNRPMYLLSR